MIFYKRLLLLAVCIRTVYLAGNLLLARYIMDYDTSSYLLSELCDSNWPEAVAKAQQHYPWVVWDSVFTHRIAACGYEYEQHFAFFPAFSGLVRMIRAVGLLHGPWGFTIAALSLNNCLFLLSVMLLARLGEQFLKDDKLSVTAVLFFITSPASVHHSMMYTEALFTASSWLGLYCLYCRRSSAFASLVFAVSAGTRSNGVLNAGFLLHEHGRHVLQAWPHRKVHAVWQLVQAIFYSAVTAAPYFAYTWFGYQQFCTGVYAGDQQRPWCTTRLHSAYGYVQDVYWNVGFLRYYEWNQIPNFLIAGPTLVLSLWGPLAYACANPHLFMTGGLLSQQQLSQWFDSSCNKHLTKAARQRQRPQQQQQPGDGAQRCTDNSSRSTCAILAPVLVGYIPSLARCRYSSTLTDTDSHGMGVASNTATATEGSPAARELSPGQLQPLKQMKKIQGVSYHSLRERQLGVLVGKGSGELPMIGCSQQQQQEMQQDEADSYSIGECSCAAGQSYYSPSVAVFIFHWLFLTLVCLAVVHIQVSTRFLSSCVPLYWFAAALMLHKGGVLRWLLWWYCFAFMGVGAVLFTNFYPWT